MVIILLSTALILMFDAGSSTSNVTEGTSSITLCVSAVGAEEIESPYYFEVFLGSDGGR